MNTIQQFYQNWIRPIPEFGYHLVVSIYEKMQQAFLNLAEWISLIEQNPSLRDRNLTSQISLDHVQEIADVAKRALQCLICLEEIGENSAFICHPKLENPEHQHVFHKECMDHWLEQKNTCPTCKEELPGFEKKARILSAEEERQSQQEAIDAAFVSSVKDLEIEDIENYLVEQQISDEAISGAFNNLFESVQEAVASDLQFDELIPILLLLYQTEKVEDEIVQLASQFFSDKIISDMEIAPKEEFSELIEQFTELFSLEQE